MLKSEDHDHDDNMRPLQTATGAERLLVPAQPPQPNLPRYQSHSLAATLGLTIVTTHQHDRVSAGVLAIQYKYVLLLPIFY